MGYAIGGNSDRNAQESVRRCTRCIRSVARRPVLLTLTIAENLTGDEGRERFHTAFKRFLRTLRDFGLRFPYVAIAEYQARGARHYHLAIPPDYIDYKIVWSHWNNALAHCGFGKGANGKHGGVHFGGYSRGENIRGYKAVANYLTKYMLKNEGDEECRIGKTHRFTSTRGLIIRERHGRYDVQMHTSYENVVRRVWSKKHRRVIEYHTRERRTYHNRDFKWSAIAMSAAQVREIAASRSWPRGYRHWSFRFGRRERECVF